MINFSESRISSGIDLFFLRYFFRISSKNNSTSFCVVSGIRAFFFSETFPRYFCMHSFSNCYSSWPLKNCVIFVSQPVIRLKSLCFGNGREGVNLHDSGLDCTLYHLPIYVTYSIPILLKISQLIFLRIFTELSPCALPDISSEKCNGLFQEFLKFSENML